jgi:hypothetical protein
VMFCQQEKPRAGAQTNLSDGENLVEGDLLHSLLYRDKLFRMGCVCV